MIAAARSLRRWPRTRDVPGVARRIWSISSLLLCPRVSTGGEPTRHSSRRPSCSGWRCRTLSRFRPAGDAATPCSPRVLPPLDSASRERENSW